VAATLGDLIANARDKANVAAAQFVTDAQIVVYLNEALKQMRELIVAADDSYYQATLDFSIGAQPLNLQTLPADFWKMRGLDAYAGDSLRQTEVYAREYRNRFAAGLGYYFGGDGNSIVIVPGFDAPQANPFRLTYTPKLTPLASLRFIQHGPGDGTNAGEQWFFDNGAFTAGDVGATMVVYGSGTILDGTWTIASVVDANRVNTTVAPGALIALGASSVVSIQTAGTRTSLDVTEDNFSEYPAVRAAMAIARKKRQDSLVAQLAAERADIEGRISAMSKMRQSEPQQAPVAWRPSFRLYPLDEWEL